MNHPYSGKMPCSPLNHHARICNYPARRAWVYFFSPSSALWNACPMESIL